MAPASARCPRDLLLASLSSCYALALAWAARKRGFELPDLEVTATGTYAGQRFATLELTVTTSLSAERTDAASRAGPPGLLRLEHPHAHTAHHGVARVPRS